MIKNQIQPLFNKLLNHVSKYDIILCTTTDLINHRNKYIYQLKKFKFVTVFRNEIILALLSADDGTRGAYIGRICLSNVSQSPPKLTYGQVYVLFMQENRSEYTIEVTFRESCLSVHVAQNEQGSEVHFVSRIGNVRQTNLRLCIGRWLILKPVYLAVIRTIFGNALP